MLFRDTYRFKCINQSICSTLRYCRLYKISGRNSEQRFAAHVSMNNLLHIIAVTCAVRPAATDTSYSGCSPAVASNKSSPVSVDSVAAVAASSASSIANHPHWWYCYRFGCSPAACAPSRADWWRPLRRPARWAECLWWWIHVVWTDYCRADGCDLVSFLWETGGWRPAPLPRTTAGLRNGRPWSVSGSSPGGRFKKNNVVTNIHKQK